MAVMTRAFRFKLKPTKAQHNRLREALEYSRQLYNAALEERIDYYRKTGKGRSYYSQCLALTELRASGSPWAATMERAPLMALDQAYRAFFKRGGFPRFKGRDWFKSIGWIDASAWHLADGRFRAKGLGPIRVHQHRDLPAGAKMKKAHVKRESRHWFLSVLVELPLPASNDNVDGIGLDLGLSSFAALSDGTLIPNPRRAAKAQRELRKRQRSLARCKRGSKGRRKTRDRLAAAHSRVKRARRTGHFQLASSLVQRFGLIAVEDLNVRGPCS